MGRWACMIAWSHTYTTYSTSFHVRTELRTFTFTELVQVPVTLLTGTVLSPVYGTVSCLFLCDVAGLKQPLLRGHEP